MARGKKGKKSVRKAQSVESPKTEKQSKSQTGVATRGRFTLLDYIIICVFFVAFCFLQKYVATWMLQEGVVGTLENLERNAINFFFDTMWKGFLIVAVLVAIHDFFYRGDEEEESP